MTCHEIQELLVELAYDELPADRKSAVLEHLGSCSACKGEYEELAHVRSALRKWRADEPAEVKAVSSLPQSAPARVLRPRWLRPLLVIGAAAAMFVIAIWVVHNAPEIHIVPPVQAEDLAVKVERTNVSLTIFSEPPDWAGILPRRQYQQKQQYVPQSDDFAGQSMVQTDYQPAGWPGMAMVRDQRLIVNLPKGVTSVKFTDVPSGILPDSVRLRSVDAPAGLSILEQNYQYDLASAWAVLHKYIDQSITVLPTVEPANKGDGKPPVAYSGKLLSFDEQQLVLSVDGAPRMIGRKDLAGIAFGKLPEGLLTRPTLLWHLDNVAADRQKLEVAYMTMGLKWRADYVLKLRPAKGAAAAAALAAASRPAGDAWKTSPVVDVIDTADLVGYATVENNSGVSYKQAELKLMAGDVHFVREEGRRFDDKVKQNAMKELEEVKEQGFVEKSFFEYHLYTLGQPTTIADREVKQLELVTGSGLGLRRGYIFDPQQNLTAAQVVSEMMNSKENGLGQPLPKGVMRLYAPDPEGVDTYVSQTGIDHTPVKEVLRLPWGYAFDVVCGVKQVSGKSNGDTREDTFEYRLRNHKDYGINITVTAHVPATAMSATCPWPWHVREVGTVEMYVPVKANSEAKFNFSVTYGLKSGGGLKSPGTTEAKDSVHE